MTRAGLRSPLAGVRHRLDQRRRAAQDRSIAENLRRFRATVDDDAVAAWRRPEGWQSSIEILIPCFNHGRYLADAWGSVLGQTWRPPLTVTFIDDASTDDSLAVMRRLASEPPDGVTTRVVANERNLNQAGALNAAIATSASALFMVLNADDLLVPWCLETVVGLYERHPQVAMVGGGAIVFEGDAPPEAPARPTARDLEPQLYEPADALAFTHLDSISMSQSSCSFFRGAWELVGGYEPDRRRRVCSHDDRDFQMRVCSVLPVAVIPSCPLELYRTSSSQGRGAA